ncbi:MAG TPA: DUF2461 domain-containing protein [Anaeromyxobacteraceae bacterium]
MVRSRPDAPVPGPFRGFPDSSGRFFLELALHNDRDWFQAHRAEYVDGWAEPMGALLAEVRDRIAGAYGRLSLALPKVFRIHRDVRFSKDKSPYKTHVAGLVALEPATGREPAEPPAAIYFHVGVDERFAGTGLWTMAPETLRRFRAAIADPRRGTELARHLAPLLERGFTLSAPETLRRVPAGVDPDHPRGHLLRMKGLVVAPPEVPRRLLTKPALVEWLADQARAAAPVAIWLARHAA